MTEQPKQAEPPLLPPSCIRCNKPMTSWGMNDEGDETWACKHGDETMLIAVTHRRAPEPPAAAAHLRLQTQVNLKKGHGYQIGDAYQHDGQGYYVCGHLADAIFILPDRRKRQPVSTPAPSATMKGGDTTMLAELTQAKADAATNLELAHNIDKARDQLVAMLDALRAEKEAVQYRLDAVLGKVRDPDADWNNALLWEQQLQAHSNLERERDKLYKLSDTALDRIKTLEQELAAARQEQGALRRRVFELERELAGKGGDHQ